MALDAVRQLAFGGFRAIGVILTPEPVVILRIEVFYFVHYIVPDNFLVHVKALENNASTKRETPRLADNGSIGIGIDEDITGIAVRVMAGPIDNCSRPDIDDIEEIHLNNEVIDSNVDVDRSGGDSRRGRGSSGWDSGRRRNRRSGRRSRLRRSQS